MKRRLFVLAPLIAVVVTVLSSFISIQPLYATVYAAIPNDATLQKQGEATAECKSAGFGHQETVACGKYYVKGYKNPNDNQVEKNVPVVCKSEGILISVCEVGYTKGQKDRKTADADAKQPATTPDTLTDNQIKELGKTNVECAQDTGFLSALMSDCVAGYLGGYKGQDKDTVCDSRKVTSPDTCKRGYDAGAKDKAAKVTNKSQQAKKSTVPSTPNSTANEQLDCDATFNNPLSWIMCPLIDTLASVIDGLDHIITQYMEIDTDSIFSTKSDTYQAYHDVWQQFRNIALGMMIIAGLIIVISQALGMEVLDAYTIRKTLPRLLIAAIAISLSWPLMHFLIDASNWLGFGIRRLIYYPFTQGDLKTTIDLSFGGGIWNILGGGATAAVGATAGTLWLLMGGIGVVLFYAGSGALAVMVAILVLVLRQIAIIFLMLIAPLAIIMYALPNTEKYYKFWWESFSKALLMFPLIAAFIAVGRVFAAVSFHNINGGGINAAISQLIGFIAYFAPYFLIPLTFRFAGGFVRQLGGFVNDRSKGGFDYFRKKREAQRQQMSQDIKSGQALRILGPGKKGGLRDTVNTGMQTAALAGSAGLNPRDWRGNLREARMLQDAQRRAASSKDENLASVASYDDLARYVTETGGNHSEMRALMRKDGIEDAATQDQMVNAWEIARKRMAKSGYSHDAILQSMMLSGLSAKTAYRHGKWDEDQQKMVGMDYDEDGRYIGNARIAEDIARLSGGNLGTIAQMVGSAAEITKSAGRPDEMPGFSDSFEAVTAMAGVGPGKKELRNLTRDQWAKRLLRKTIYKEGLSAMVGGTAHATRHLMPAFEDTLKESGIDLARIDKLKPGDAPITVDVYDESEGRIKPVEVTTENAADVRSKVERNQKQVVAQILGLQDVNGNLPPEKQAIVAALLNTNIGTKESPKSIQDFITPMRTDAVVNQFKADYRFGHEGASNDEVGGATQGQKPPPGDIQPPAGFNPTPPI